LCAADIGLDIVADHEDLAGIEPKPASGRLQEPGGRLAEQEFLPPGGVLQRRHERRRVQRDAIRRQPVASHAQGDQFRFRIAMQQAEGTVQGSEVPQLAEIAHHHVGRSVLGVVREARQPGELPARGLAHKERDRPRRSGAQPLRRRGSRRENLLFRGSNSQRRKLLAQCGATS
jgi:hypothetical protein